MKIRITMFVLFVRYILLRNTECNIVKNVIVDIFKVFIGISSASFVFNHPTYNLIQKEINPSERNIKNIINFKFHQYETNKTHY